jgi:hypothetical protein
VITLGLSQREADRVLEAMGLKNRARTGDAGAAGAGNGGSENPRRIFRVAFYGAIGSLITAGVVWMGKSAAASAVDGVRNGVRAELALHRTVAGHTDQLKDHDVRIRGLEAQALPGPTAARLIELLEAERRERERARAHGRQR